MTRPPVRFDPLARVLHWTMAALIVAMLFIGIGMVSTLSPRYDRLLAIHRSIGITILVLVAIRLVNRLLHRQPPLPPGLPDWQRLAADASHYILYFLMFALPLVGWAMLSAGGYPIEVFGTITLPPILPRSVAAFSMLRTTHTVLAMMLLATFLLHLAAALYHRFVRRDDVLQEMIG